MKKKKQSYQLYLSKRSPPNNFNDLIVLCFHAQISYFINGFFIWENKTIQDRYQYDHQWITHKWLSTTNCTKYINSTDL